MKRLMFGGGYLAAMILTAVWSYRQPSYDFCAAWQMLLVAVLGAVCVWHWWRRKITRLDWWLAAGLIAVALATFPWSSRDHLRYLFDGEMLRVWHMSPYVHLPREFPADQYSSGFYSTWWTVIPSPYGPVWQALMVLVNLVSGNSLVWGVVALKLINLAALLVSARYLCLITGRAWAGYVFMICPVVLADTVVTPHTEVVLVAMLLAAYYHRKVVLRALLIAGAALIKPHMLLFVPLLGKTWRERGILACWTAAALGVMLVMLRRVIGFEPLAMLMAGAGGALSTQSSLVAYQAFRGLGSRYVAGASGGLLVLLYGAVMALFIRRRISMAAAVGLASLVVPMAVTGQVFPWHFILPIGCLLLTDSAAVRAALAFSGIVLLRPSCTGLEIICSAVLLWALWTLGRWAAAGKSRGHRMAFLFN